MKKIMAIIILAIASGSATAYTQLYNGVWYGNVCRTGYYYSFVPYQPVGAGCWNSGWGVYGVITNE